MNYKKSLLICVIIIFILGIIIYCTSSNQCTFDFKNSSDEAQTKDIGDGDCISVSFCSKYCPQFNKSGGHFHVDISSDDFEPHSHKIYKTKVVYKYDGKVYEEYSYDIRDVPESDPIMVKEGSEPVGVTVWYKNK